MLQRLPEVFLTGFYVELKELAARELVLARDALHIYGGFFIFIAVLFAARTRRPQWWMVLPGLILSIVIELLDLTGFGGFLGDPPTLREAVKDIVNTNAVAVLFVAIEKRLARKHEEPRPITDRRVGDRRSG